MNISKTAKQAARLSKGVSPDGEYVAIWEDGSVTMPDCATEARGNSGGFEWPILSLHQPYTVAEIAAALRQALSA